MKRWIKGMRDAFFDSLFEVAKKDKNLVLVTSDTGAICHDDFREHLPDQYINVGIAEQNMIGIASGLAMTGKTVYCYAIVPFATMRCLEQIKVDVCCMNLSVNIVGIGCGFDYSTLGPTHHGTEDISIMRTLPGMSIYSPSDSEIASRLAEYSWSVPGPKYIRLDRTGLPLIPGGEKMDLEKGVLEIKQGSDVLIISTGRMTDTALQVSDILKQDAVDAAIVDIMRLQPLNSDVLTEILSKYKKIITLEEHFLTGGLGSAILEFLNSKALSKNILRVGIEDCFCRVYGKRDHLQKENALDPQSIASKISEWTKAV